MPDWQPIETAPFLTVILVRNPYMDGPVRATRGYATEIGVHPKGLTGAKPARFCEWVLGGLNYQPGDTVDDLFPGTGIMGRVVAERSGASAAPSGDLFEECRSFAPEGQR